MSILAMIDIGNIVWEYYEIQTPLTSVLLEKL